MDSYEEMYNLASKMKKTVLVTGGTGLVGNAIKSIRHLYPYYDFVFISSKSFDLSKMEQTLSMFKTFKPTYVIHLAACVGGLYKNMNHNVEMFEKNMIINYNVIHCAHKFEVKKLIACLSTCIYPDDVSYPISEDMLHKGPPHSSNYGYAYAKRMLEVHCRLYKESYGDNFMCVIPTNIYGPHDNFDLENGHVLPALIHRCFLAKKNNIDFVMRGSGKPLRQFIYSEDLAKLIMHLLQSSNKENVILSSPEKDETSIENVARMIARCFDYEDRLVFDVNYADGQYKKTVSNEKLMGILKSECSKFEFTELEDGIKKTVEWFIENN
jgi:GDP-L-fucose synthase